MKHQKVIDRQPGKLLGLFAAATLGLCLTACTTTAPAPEPQEEPPVAEAIEIEPWDGDGMDIPLDGSSLEAFERSLARVEAHTSPTDYATLVNAIDYLLFYDLAANHDKATLAARLDGLTGNQVVRKVGWRKPKR
jgi:hypothetical protein